MGLTTPGKGLCLIVDDSTVDRAVLQACLEKNQWDTKHAETGHKALDYCAQEMPDILILDLHIPDIDGLELLKSLREMEGGKNPHVIMCSGTAVTKHVKEALSNGANDFVIKPVNFDILTKKLAKIR